MRERRGSLDKTEFLLLATTPRLDDAIGDHGDRGHAAAGDDAGAFDDLEAQLAQRLGGQTCVIGWVP